MTRIAFTLLLVILIHPQALCAPVPVERWSAEKDAEFEKLWNAIDWYQPNAVKFWCRVHANPRAGYAFLDRKIEPIQLSEAAGKRLIDDLGSDDERVWKAAEARLKTRDIRLAMNFLDAWDYAKTDIQKQRLTTATLGITEHPQYYDFKLERRVGVLGQPPMYSVNLTLRRDVDKELAEHLGLYHGCGYCLSLDQLETPAPYKLICEQAVARYLAQSQKPQNKLLVQRLLLGNSADATTKIALAGNRHPKLRKLDPEVNVVRAASLPILWEKWCTSADESDPLTAEFLASPELAVAFLKTKLKPIRIDPFRIGLLLTLLAHPSDEVWRRAADAMRNSDPRLCLPVEILWNMAKTVQQRQRLACLLVPGANEGNHWDYAIHRDNHRGNNRNEKCYGLSCWVRKDLPPESLPAEFRDRGSEQWGFMLAETADEVSKSKWFREEAAIWVLEAIGTDDALAIVKRMATGHPDARPTIAAKEVLARRDRR